MNILVCVKRVADTAETEVSPNSSGDDIERDDLVYTINEPDNYAVEEALRIAERTGGKVTVVTVGGDDDEEVLRRQMAMGAGEGVLLSDDLFAGSDGRGIAAILAAYVRTGDFDLILTGVQAEDGAAQIGGMLAAMLDHPFASVVSSIELLAGGALKVVREIAGGNQEVNEISLPCVLSIQTGINEPRYVGMRGIRKVASIPIQRLDSSHLELAKGSAGRSAAKAFRLDYFLPAASRTAEILTGSREEIAGTLFELLKAKGGLN